jgi:hypothetical protein
VNKVTLPGTDQESVLGNPVKVCVVEYQDPEGSSKWFRKTITGPEHYKDVIYEVYQHMLMMGKGLQKLPETSVNLIQEAFKVP